MFLCIYVPILEFFPPSPPVGGVHAWKLVFFSFRNDFISELFNSFIGPNHRIDILAQGGFKITELTILCVVVWFEIRIMVLRRRWSSETS